MKKFFTLIAATMMVAGANAQKEWNFSNWEQKTFTATETIEGLTVSASAEASVVIDGNNKTVDDVKYTQRLKTGGTGSADARTLSFDVPGNCTITVIACSSNSSSDRTLNYAAGTFDAVFTTSIAPAGAPVKTSVSYEGPATTLYLSSASGGINFYDIAFTPTGGTNGINNINVAPTANENAPVYNLAGQRVNKEAKGILIQNGRKVIK